MLNNYSITDLEDLTGIKAHTIRVWEKRYELLCPKRDVNNVRTYCEKDLNRLVKITALYQNGEKVSVLSELQEEELNEKYMSLLRHRAPCQGMIDGLTMVVQRFDEQALIKQLSEKLEQEGTRKFHFQLIEPLKQRLGLFLLSGQMQNVHIKFANEIIEDVLRCANLKLTLENGKKCKKVLLLRLNNEGAETFNLALKHFLLQKNIVVVSCQVNTSSTKCVEAVAAADEYNLVLLSANQTKDNTLQYYSYMNRYLDSTLDWIVCGSGQNQIMGLDETKIQRLNEQQVFDYLENHSMYNNSCD